MDHWIRTALCLELLMPRNCGERHNPPICSMIAGVGVLCRSKSHISKRFYYSTDRMTEVRKFSFTCEQRWWSDKGYINLTSPLGLQQKIPICVALHGFCLSFVLFCFVWDSYLFISQLILKTGIVYSCPVFSEEAARTVELMCGVLQLH